jgi:Kef-type K+ transport system membrane component KefB
MRRAMILALLLLAMALIKPLGEPGRAETLLSFGFMILAAYTVGEVASALRLPKIVGYMVAGILFGPSVLGIVSKLATMQLASVSQLAIALIAFLAGAELEWAEVRRRGVTILKILGSELGICFLALVTLLLALRPWVPFLEGTGTAAAIALAVLFASVAIVHSPAVTMALLTETRAKGDVARTTLGVVLVADVAVILLFTGALAIARALAPSAAGGSEMSFLVVAWEILGSIVVGAALGGIVALYLKFVQRELFLFALVATMFGAELARLLHVETLLTLLVAGFVAENATDHEGKELRHAMERAAAPVFVVFFALAGAKLGLGEIVAMLPIAIPVVLVRIFAIRIGTILGARWAGLPGEQGRLISMGLVSQAGVAIGLSAVIAEAYPERGPAIAALFLAVIAINETLGPIFFRNALVKAGEVTPEDAADAAVARPATAH